MAPLPNTIYPMTSTSVIQQPTQRVLGLFYWLVLCFCAAALGALASANAGDFYGQLIRPTWAPPAWLFGPVWTILYAMMAVAAWLVWVEKGWDHAGGALRLFILQLGANALWSWIFFAWHMGAIAFAEIVLLWGLIAWTLVSFWRIRKLSGVLLVPYLLWVSFATVLSFSMWQGNPQIL